MPAVVAVGFRQVLLLLQQLALVEPAAVEPAARFQPMVQQGQRILVVVGVALVVAVLLQLVAPAVLA
jgi:hypothetical protein